MTGDWAEEAIRRVLPALNIHPRSFDDHRGFVARARRRTKPSILSLGDLADQLVFFGTVDGTDPEVMAADAGERAVRELTDFSREACKRIVVVWEDGESRAYAAAFTLTADSTIGACLGVSWEPPENWPQPMIDASKPHNQILDAALERVCGVVARGHAQPDFTVQLERELSLLNAALEFIGGEGLDIGDQRRAITVSTDWETWFQDLERSVHDEWRRVRGGERGSRIGVMPPTSDGPLAGLRVFLSYARPDVTTLARPTYRALQAVGAQVWFDQEEPLQKIWLDEGLAAKIGECDAFVMCASDEYVERAGYATQELAWAFEQAEAGGRLKHFLVVARPETVLPSLLADWPLVEIRYQSQENFGSQLADALLAKNAVNVAAPRQVDLSTPISPPVLSPEADLTAVRLRVRHLRRFLELTPNSVIPLAAGAEDDAQLSAIRGQLREVGKGLDWDGSLAELDRWPDDPYVRGCRWDLACLRALAGTRWPLSGDLRVPDGIARDVERIATQAIALLAWPNACGWADNERRLFVRRHAQLLRVLQELLSRGIYGGLLDVDSKTLDIWARAVVARRRECHDALIAMRLTGSLSWWGDPPTWDRLFRDWLKFLQRVNAAMWTQRPPSEVLMLLSANAEDIAAVAANVGWTIAQLDDFARQTIEAQNWYGPISADISAASSPDKAVTLPNAERKNLEIGFVHKLDGRSIIRLGWYDMACDPPTGTSSTLAPENLHQALGRFRRSISSDVHRSGFKSSILGNGFGSASGYPSKFPGKNENSTSTSNTSLSGRAGSEGSTVSRTYASNSRKPASVKPLWTSRDAASNKLPK